MRPSLWVAKLTQIGVAIVEILLGLRFLFRLFDGDSSRLFIGWLYQNTHSVLKPFQTAFPEIRAGGFSFELSTLVAMVSWAFAGYLILVVVGWTADKADLSTPKRRFSFSLKPRR